MDLPLSRLQSLSQKMSDLPIGGLRYYDQIDSTNEEAARWAEAGAPDLALVVADEQTRGRGRAGRPWYTPPGAALAFTLILRHIFPPFASSPDQFFHLTALGAVAICQALKQDYGLDSQIKWPNDVLLTGRKVAGILVETHWQDNQPTAAMLGIGVNIAPGSVPVNLPLLFPATCIEAVLGRPVDRLELLHIIVGNILAWRAWLGTTKFLQAWEDRLALRGEWVQLFTSSLNKNTLLLEGQLLGLETDGGLRLRDAAGQIQIIRSGELRLRPLIP